jgi:hypothetical protein
MTSRTDRPVKAPKQPMLRMHKVMAMKPMAKLGGGAGPSVKKKKK